MKESSQIRLFVILMIVGVFVITTVVSIVVLKQIEDIKRADKIELNNKTDSLKRVIYIQKIIINTYEVADSLNQKTHEKDTNYIRVIVPDINKHFDTGSRLY